jgi:signal transduction histidine kinase
VKFPKVLTSLTFRYIAKYLAVLTLSVFLLQGGLYAYFSFTYFGTLSETIVDELETLEIVYNGQGLEGIKTYVEDQRKNPAAGGFYYLVVDQDGRKLAGDLEVSPSYVEFSGGWIGFELALPRWGEEVEVDFLARWADLDSGVRVMTARNYADAIEKSSLVFRTLIRAMIATMILGLIGGFFSASSTLNRVEALNREMSRIMRGDPSQRLDLVSEEGYVQELAIIMNSMLDQIESLLQGVRHVADNIAHDLRTPLTRMHNQLSQLRGGLDTATPEDVDVIVAECDELLSSFNALLKISTLETGKRLTTSAEVDLGALLKDVVEMYEPLAQAKNVNLTLEADSQLCKGEADLLFQMLVNLLDNAVKYTPPNGSIEVRLLRLVGRDGGNRIIVNDSGPGIAEVDRKNVFQRFFRVESSRSEQPGHGLGLSLVQAIVQYHGGSIMLLSNNPGLRVQITLPALR